MPSPFPGMDPWLESPEHWHNVHQILLTLIASELNCLGALLARCYDEGPSRRTVDYT
jgi:Protein of unknown function (DUF4058)